MDTFGRARRVVQRVEDAVAQEGEGTAHEAYTNRKTAEAVQQSKTYTNTSALVLKGNVYDAKRKRVSNVGQIVTTTDACTLASLQGRVPMFKKDGNTFVVDMKSARVSGVLLPQTPQDAVNKAYLDAVLPFDVKPGNTLSVRKRRITDVANPTETYDACTKLYVDGLVAKSNPIDVTREHVMNVKKRRITQVLTPVEEDDACTKEYVDERVKSTNLVTVDETVHPPTLQVYNRRLINLASPVDSQDAVTLAYMQRAISTALSYVSPVTLLTIESLYPHPPINTSLPGKWYMLPTGRHKFDIPCDGTLVLRSVSPLLRYLQAYVNVTDYHKLPTALQLTIDKPFPVQKGQTFAFRLHGVAADAHMDDFHLYLLFEYRMDLPLLTPPSTRPFDRDV